jgi:hypothetical protein
MGAIVHTSHSAFGRRPEWARWTCDSNAVVTHVGVENRNAAFAVGMKVRVEWNAGVEPALFGDTMRVVLDVVAGAEQFAVRDRARRGLAVAVESPQPSARLSAVAIAAE